MKCADRALQYQNLKSSPMTKTPRPRWKATVWALLRPQQRPLSMSAKGQSRQIVAGRKSLHVRCSPKATQSQSAVPPSARPRCILILIDAARKRLWVRKHRAESEGKGRGGRGRWVKGKVGEGEGQGTPGTVVACGNLRNCFLLIGGSRLVRVDAEHSPLAQPHFSLLTFCGCNFSSPLHGIVSELLLVAIPALE
jgi:hypothetical protein